MITEHAWEIEGYGTYAVDEFDKFSDCADAVAELARLLESQGGGVYSVNFEHYKAGDNGWVWSAIVVTEP